MAKYAFADRGLSISQVCRAFGISETCCRYQPKLSGENAEIADWLVRLAPNQTVLVPARTADPAHCSIAA